LLVQKKNASLKFTQGLKLFPSSQEEYKSLKKKPDNIKTISDFENYYVCKASTKDTINYVHKTSFQLQGEGESLQDCFNKIQTIN